ncbi:MAG TPA: Crp/Fnr family transcriptional regulator [Gaiellaceae bacterium]|jgi:CRP/FNR family cyclic AMP-dependent transcriptional regulator|nr:Crp/Fnr family transcriptional regulator [Gaiellaceae bacterium]
MSAPVDVLRKVPLFADLDDEDLGRLANQMKERRYAEGSPMTSEGSGGAGFFVITEGNATVSVGGEVKSTLGPGDYFGEIALIDEGTRTASITAATDVTAYGMTSWEFKPFVEDHPQVAWALLKTLAQRLRAAQAHE